MEARKTLLRLGVVIGLAFAVVVFIGGDEAMGPTAPEAEQTTEQVETSTESSDTGAPATEIVRGDTVRAFTAAEFKQAYDQLALPNITPIINPPSITGNDQADAVIQAAAEARGYQLRDVASGLLNEIEGKPVQELLIQSWQELQQSAIDDGVSISFVSGYRSIEEQRDLFLARMSAAGITNTGLIEGTANGALDSLLAVTAPPGYSRHHSGYTIDVEDPGFSIFANSTAYGWISANNFEKAKEHGFIPSYPNGLTNQGPNPEPWEFVWVGPTVTYE